jgi:hypothetical protein
LIFIDFGKANPKRENNSTLNPEADSWIPRAPEPNEGPNDARSWTGHIHAKRQQGGLQLAIPGAVFSSFEEVTHFKGRGIEQQSRHIFSWHERRFLSNLPEALKTRSVVQVEKANMANIRARLNNRI